MVSADVALAIANVAIFLEFASSEILDEDSAVQAMERLSFDLKRLDEASRRELTTRLHEISSTYDDTTRDFVANLPEALGLL